MFYNNYKRSITLKHCELLYCTPVNLIILYENYVCACVCVCVCVCAHACAQSCPALCDPMDCSLPGSSVHGIFQARILEQVAISSSRGSS